MHIERPWSRSLLRGALSVGLLLALPALGAGACATGSAPAGTTGGGGSGAGGGDTSSSTGGGPCVYADDCAGVSDACNVGTCINGACVKMPANDGTQCDDGQYCTEIDTCLGGVCGGAPRFCPSDDPCHVGVCDEATHGCKAAPGNDGAQCDDGDACTFNGTCFSGSCQKGAPIDCTVFDGECTQGSCDPQMGCVGQPIHEGQKCTGGLDPLGCNDGVCESGLCAPVPKADGVGCDDGQFCTVGDSCKSGVCGGAPNPCAGPSGCMIGVCDELMDVCSAQPVANGTGCTDGNPCTSGETCTGGVCLGGQPSNEGGACDDGDACSLGTTCQGGVCGNPTSEVAVCQGGDGCCPPGCALNQDGDCIYWKAGVQQNVPDADLVGWSQCYGSTYADLSPITPVVVGCNKAKLMLACRPIGSPTWSLVAMGPREDVLFDCGQQESCTKESNGVGFYFDQSWSWGFAPAGAAVHRNACDQWFNETSPELRMCWYTKGDTLNIGFRCGANDVSGSPGWERAVFQAD